MKNLMKGFLNLFKKKPITLKDILNDPIKFDKLKFNILTAPTREEEKLWDKYCQYKVSQFWEEYGNMLEKMVKNMAKDKDEDK